MVSAIAAHLFSPLRNRQTRLRRSTCRARITVTRVMIYHLVNGSFRTAAAMITPTALLIALLPSA